MVYTMTKATDQVECTQEYCSQRNYYTLNENGILYGLYCNLNLHFRQVDIRKGLNIVTIWSLMNSVMSVKRR